MSNDANQHPEPVVVATYPDLGEAEVAKAHLLGQGIHAEIIDQAEGGVIPVEGDDGPHILVPAEDADAARALLEELPRAT